MKRLCLLILIAFIFGDTYLPKYESIYMNTESGIFYFNTSDFEADSELYFQLNAENGKVYEFVMYEFSSIEPSDSHSFKNYTKLEKYASASSSTTINGETTRTSKYYYELKNDNTQKYLYVKYKSFNGTSLEIESTRLRLTTYIFIIILIVVVSTVVINLILFFIVLTIVKKIIRAKKNNAYNNVPQNQYHNMNNNPQQEQQEHQQEHQDEHQEQQEIQDDQSQHIVINS